MLGADAVMGSDQPGFDVAEERMDDREEFARIGAGALGHRGVFQVFAKGGVAPLVSFEAVGQEVRASLDIGLEERPSSAPVAAGSTAMRAFPA